MIKIKEILNDLVEYAYKDDCKESYKKFYVELSDKVLKSKNGHYEPQKHKIVIFNLYRDDSIIVKTTIHELAHHIDYCNRGITDHSKMFYETYFKLLYKALDMQLFSKKEFLEATRDSSDYNKVSAVLTAYEPQKSNYKFNKRIIECLNCYNHKDNLKEHGYRYNVVNKTWEKEILREDEQREIEHLDALEIDYNLLSPTEIKFNKKLYLIASTGSYAIKDDLKKNGFKYKTKNKTWIKEATKDEFYIYQNMYPNVVFKLTQKE